MRRNWQKRHEGNVQEMWGDVAEYRDFACGDVGENCMRNKGKKQMKSDSTGPYMRLGIFEY